MDFDDTITSPFIPAGRLKGQRIHDISRILAAKELGIEIGNEILTNLTPQQSEESYVKAAEPTLEGSIAYLFKKAGIFDSQIDYDASDERFQSLIKKRSELHTRLLETYVGLNPGAQELMTFAHRNLKHGLAIASMAKISDIRIVLDKFDLGELIPEDRIISGDLVRRPKPNREAFDRAYHALGIPSTGNAKLDSKIRLQTIAIDDSRGGVASAHSSGCFTAGLTTNLPAEAFGDTQAHVVLPSLRVAKTILKNNVAA